jgi:hypothetical protein
VSVLRLVFLCLGLLWLRPWPVATTMVAALTPGLAVLCTLALATQCWCCADPACV